MTELGRSSISLAFSNFSCSSLFPMTLAAWLICRISSCNRRNTRMSEPSNWSVNCIVKGVRVRSASMMSATADLADIGE